MYCSTGVNNNEDRPFVEMFNSATPTTKEKENSVSLKGIQVDRSLLNTNDLEPDEEILNQGMKILRTIIEYSDGRKVVKTYDNGTDCVPNF
jgi:hypothetical protein